MIKSSLEITLVGKILELRSAISGEIESVNTVIVESERTCAVEIVEIKSKTRMPVR